MIKKYTIIGKDGEFNSFQEPHGGTRIGRFLLRTPKIEDVNGEKFLVVKKRKYHITGPWNTFRYRLARSLWVFNHTGLQKVWMEDDPTPFYLSRSVKSPFRDTAEALYHITESNVPERLLQPRKHDWTVILLVAIMMLAVGIALGGRVG